MNELLFDNPIGKDAVRYEKRGTISADSRYMLKIFYSNLGCRSMTLARKIAVEILKLTETDDNEKT